jgi:uncharacterized protein YajQ (UPF0234 family)
MKIFGVLILILLTISCKKKEEINAAEVVINKAIARAGGKVLDNATITFDFRDKHYKAKRENGNFSLTRCSDVTCKDTLDVLSNSGFERKINDKPIKLTDSLIDLYSNSVNSVHYFSVLPYGLDNSAVKKEILDTVDIKGHSYYKIKVIFEQQGGGKDYEDEYMYWVNTKDFTVDYLAYNYHVNEGGTRFREAFNAREINGVRVMDYKNYKPKEQYPALESLDSLFLKEQLDLLSLIELKNVEIKDCPNC